MAHWRDTGFAAVVVGDGEYRFPAEAYERLLREWKAGAAFLDGIGLFGERMSVRCARVEGVQLWTAEQRAELLEDQKADRREREREI